MAGPPAEISGVAALVGPAEGAAILLAGDMFPNVDVVAELPAHLARLHTIV